MDRRNGQMLKYRYRQDIVLPVPISDDVVPVPISDDVVTVQLGIYDTAVLGLPRGRNIGSLATPLIHIYGDSGIVPVDRGQTILCACQDSDMRSGSSLAALLVRLYSSCLSFV